MLSIGGANAILPEIHRRAVEVHHWMTDADFAQLFALSQAAPGPNVLIVSLVGWKTAGIVGAVVAMAAMCGPSCLFTYQFARAWDRFREAPLRIAIQRALAPITIGLSCPRDTCSRAPSTTIGARSRSARQPSR